MGLFKGQQSCPRLIHRLLPLSGEIKHNMDGCYYEFNKKAGFGGVFRDSSGKWILGFYGKATSTCGFEAELWAIYRGVTIILEKGMYN